MYNRHNFYNIKNDSAGDKYSRLVRDSAARAKFIKHVIEFIEKHNFDGLDLDWEVSKIYIFSTKLYLLLLLYQTVPFYYEFIF